jgi:ubiquitin-like domain-containing CTD phosphatase 1
VKLTGLGMLPNNNYKICFALDKTYMFTYKNNYVKPLKLIWLKSTGRWSEKNTVHIDDLTRNFELNKENGIVISPFFVKSPENTSPVEAAGDGEYKTDVDLELSLLGRYLVHIARNSDDFSEIDHENWRDNSILIPPIF